jgi:hypothetical protein
MRARLEPVRLLVAEISLSGSGAEHDGHVNAAAVDRTSDSPW